MKNKAEVIEATEAGQYAAFGACADQRYTVETYSIGIFKVLPKTRGKGKKAGRVIFRVKGLIDSEWAQKCAAYICWNLNQEPSDTIDSAIREACKRLKQEFIALSAKKE